MQAVKNLTTNDSESNALSRSLQLEVIRGNAPTGWNDSILTNGGCFYLTSHYGEIIRRQGAEPIYFILSNEGIAVGFALGFLNNQWMRWPAKSIFREFKWQTHPVVAQNDPLLLDSFLRLIHSQIEKIGVASIYLHSEDAAFGPSHELGANLGFSEVARLEYRITLSKDPADVLARIASRKRTYLRSAIKASSLCIQEVCNMEAVQQLIDFQQISRERRRQRGEDYSIANRFAAEHIYEGYIKPGFGRLFLSYQDGIPLSGILLHCWGGRAYYTMSGCSERGFSKNAPMMTVWGAIESLCRDGFSELNMGGVGFSAANPEDLAHGLYRFKRSFGGIETTCLTLERNIPGIKTTLRKILKR